jgi:hypothetical protein
VPFRWCITVKATIRGVNEILSISWLPHQPSHAIEDVRTPVVDRRLVMVLTSHILDGV